MSNRAKIGEMLHPDSTNVRWITHVTKRSAAEVSESDYFRDVHSWLERHMRILVICETGDGGWDEGEFVVVHSEPGCVLVQQKGAWEHFGVQTSAVLEIRNQRRNEHDQEIVDIVDTMNGRTVRAGLTLFDAHAAIAYLTGQHIPQVPVQDPVQEPEAEEDPAEFGVPIEQMTRQTMQKMLKAKTGKGLAPTATREELMAAVNALLEQEAA